MFDISSSSVMPTLPTATPKQSTFFSWNLIVDLTSVILVARSSLCEIGEGNLPARQEVPSVSADLEERQAELIHLWKDRDPEDVESV